MLEQVVNNQPVQASYYIILQVQGHETWPFAQLFKEKLQEPQTSYHNDALQGACLYRCVIMVIEGWNIVMVYLSFFILVAIFSIQLVFTDIQILPSKLSTHLWYTPLSDHMSLMYWILLPGCLFGYQ